MTLVPALPLSRIPPPARTYSGLAAGTRITRSFEAQAGLPIDGTSGLLRHPLYGSPFSFTVVLPDVLVDAVTRSMPSITNPGATDAQPDLISQAINLNNSFQAFVDKQREFRNSSYVLGNTVNADQTLSVLENIVAEGIFFSDLQPGASPLNQPAMSDVRQAADIIVQINKILQTPPLTLLVNPQTLTIQYAQKLNYSERSRQGYILHTWGEEQVKLSISGVTGAFIAGNNPFTREGLAFSGQGQVSETGSVSGVQFASRRDSAAWQNLQSLFTIYRNNGYIFDTLGQSDANLWIGGIAIEYDQWTYIGQMENFQHSLDESKQYGQVEFSFEFTASHIFDNAQRQFQVLPQQSPMVDPARARPSGGTAGRSVDSFSDLIPRLTVTGGGRGRNQPVTQAIQLLPRGTELRRGRGTGRGSGRRTAVGGRAA